jgi:hypothetical protein
MLQLVAYVLLLDGIGTIFTTTEEVDDVYAQLIGFETSHPGLERPGALPLSIEPRTGLPDGTSVTFTIKDCDRTQPLVEIFGNSLDDAEPLLVRLAAGTTAADESLFGLYVGLEKIGTEGERRRFSCVPTWHVGLEHLSEQQANATNLAAAPVSTYPVVMAGRRACLHRLVQNADGSWPDLNDEAERLATRIWYGTLTGQGEQHEKTWTLRCAGRESWMMGTIGAGFTQQPLQIEVEVQLDEDANEHLVIAALAVVDLFDESDVQYVYVEPVTDTSSLAGATSYADLCAGLDGILNNLANDAGLGPALASQGISGLKFSIADGDDGVQVRWDREAGFVALADRYCLRVWLLVHEKVLKGVGYDPATQNSSVDPIGNPEKFCLFEKPGSRVVDTATAYLGAWEVDYPNHWLGTFWAADAVAMAGKLRGSVTAAPEHTNNSGTWRRWPPIYPGGTNTFDLNATAQLFRVKMFDPLFLPGSLGVPLPADPDDASEVLNIDDVGDATHQGVVVFTGPFRSEVDPEAEVTTLQIPARVAWRQQADGSVATDSQGFPKLAIYAWPRSELYGFEAQLPTLWSAWRVPPADGEPHTVRPLLVLEHGQGPDLAAYIFARMVATTGGGGPWSGYGLGGGSTLTVGPNDLGIDLEGGLGQYTDAEVAALGLGIPAEMIALGDDQGSLERALEQQGGVDLFACKVALGKPVSARDLMRTLLAPTAWGISFAGGKIGLFDLFTFQPPATDAGAITPESLRGKAGEPRSTIPKQRLRVHAPPDRIKVDARLNPITGEFAREEVLLSPDAQRSYRKQSLEHAVDGSHLIHPLLPLPGNNWLPSFHERWRRACRWWSRQHFEVTLTVPIRRHLEFLAGAPVTISNQWLANPAGRVFGISQAPGWVMGCIPNPKTGTIEVRAIVDASTLRLYATAALAYRYDADEEDEGYRILVEDDYLGVRAGTGTFDVDGFIEPAFSTAGGDASIEVLEYDHVSWTAPGITGTVDQVNAEEGNCWIKLTGALAGTWRSDRDHLVVLRTEASQAAPWPEAVLAPIGDKQGDYDGSTMAPKFKD